EYSDMPHVLSFLQHSYDDVFNILMQDETIMSLMAPFKSAYDNNAMDQLEGMVGTLRVNAARLVSQEAYWVFSGDDFDLKVSDPQHPSYLIIANDPEKEQVIGSLNALVLNRLTTRVNSGQGKNVPVSIIIDELPTLYFHKIDRLIGTARSNKVSVTMAFQELPQLEADYGKNGMQKVITTCGNVFSGSARNKETLEWLQNDIFGKVKQTTQSISINDERISTSINEKMDNLVPAAKIADMATGWICGQTARDFTPTEASAMQKVNLEETDEFKTTKFFCKTNFDMRHIEEEKKHYIPLPKKYSFGNEHEKEVMLSRNFRRINEDINNLTSELLGKGNSSEG
ncbi:MAG: TraM recognition domain-containing protein, partial [Prevotella sp.]|nr:TraM recognition domain-containing protein [Prevotella sp.]